MKSRTPQLSLEYRYYKSLGPHCKYHCKPRIWCSSRPAVIFNSSTSAKILILLSSSEFYDLCRLIVNFPRIIISRSSSWYDSKVPKNRPFPTSDLFFVTGDWVSNRIRWYAHLPYSGGTCCVLLRALRQVQCSGYGAPGTFTGRPFRSVWTHFLTKMCPHGRHAAGMCIISFCIVPELSSKFFISIFVSSSNSNL